MKYLEICSLQEFYSKSVDPYQHGCYLYNEAVKMLNVQDKNEYIIKLIEILQSNLLLIPDTGWADIVLRIFKNKISREFSDDYHFREK